MIPLPEAMNPQPRKPDFLKGDDWFDVQIDDDFLDFDKPYRPPRYTMERNGVPFADVGELHIISGKPGHGKTGLMSQLMATILCGQHGNTLRRNVPHKVKEGDRETEKEIGTRILYIDTEQGEDDTIAIKNRVCSMAGIDYTKPCDKFTILRLRDTEEAADRWRKILKAVYLVKPTDIFLDGMLDIVRDYNDQVECQPIVRKCMKLATYYDASLWAVLHENPMAEKLVGTLGSITQRKVSEIFTVIKIKQDDLKPADKRADMPNIYFRVKQVKARGRDVGDWYFEYITNAGGWGQPVELGDDVAKAVDSKEMQFIKEADERLKTFNWTQSGATYTELERYLRKSVSGRRAGDLINIAAENGIIFRNDNKKYHYNGLKELPKDNSQDLPFEGPNGEESIF
jgi:hypothetical protein